MIRRNADGTVDHDGEYNPWSEIDRDKERECRETGGFVMRIGTAHLGRSHVGIDKDGNYYGYSDPTKFTGDGLMYVSYT